MNPHINSLLQQGLQHVKNKKYIDAEVAFKKVLRLHAKNFEALRLLGATYAYQAKHGDAQECFKKALALNPHDFYVQFNLARSLSELRDDLGALAHHIKAVQLAPTQQEAWLNYGRNLFRLGRHGEALDCHRHALAIKPDYADALLEEGVTLNTLGHDEDALLSFKRAVSINPNFAAAWSNTGSTLNKLQRYEEALAPFDQAIALMPGHAQAWLNKGRALKELKRHDEALAHYNRAIEIHPGYAQAWWNKGSLLSDHKFYDEALVHFERAIALQVQIDFVPGSYIYTKLLVCHWSDVERHIEDATQQARAGQKAIFPFLLLSLADSPALQAQAAKTLIEDRFRPNPVLPPRPKTSHDKIRLAYFSADFKDHPVSFLTAQLFEMHDRNRFEVFGFSTGSATAGDVMRPRLIAAFDHFLDVDTLSAQAIASLAREWEIDIAVDLGGHTLDARTGIFACRAAPVQVNYLGYPGTMGAPYIDYIVADKIVIPESQQSFYSEKIAYLPHCFQSNDAERKISEKVFTREELGLPANGFIFCCFNNNYKINPAMFDRWMTILAQAPDSYLWLLANTRSAAINLQREAQQRGIDPGRLIFGGRLPQAEYLARYRAADLFLDTLPFNAGTTASDALWAGLPVLTQAGQSFAGRMAASLLQAVGLPELIAETPEAYAALAIALATDADRLQQLKQKLAVQRLAMPLFDTRLFTRHIEAAYLQMHARHQADLSPAHLYIPACVALD